MTEQEHDQNHDHVHDENCGCDDEMVEIVYMAREDVLEKLGISSDEFAEALDQAIDHLESLAMDENVNDDDIPAMEDLELTIKGQKHRLGDLAEISFEGDLEDDEEGEDDGEDEDGEEEEGEEAVEEEKA